MNTVEISLAILKELEQALGQIDAEKSEALAETIIAVDRIFVAGAGRSLMMIRGLAMRLMHLRFKAYVVGETITPAIEAGDLLIIGSGSGETATLSVMANKAKEVGAKLALITIYPESTIGKLADLVIQIRAVTPKSDQDSGSKSIQPGANLFEQSLLLFCEAIVIRIIEKKQIQNSNAILMQTHANLE
jgi:6-phospho-3-hexuloisomerase